MQIEENWNIWLVKRIKEASKVEDIILGQPLLVWSAYTYSSALKEAPSIWICLVIEEFRFELIYLCTFLAKTYSTISPRRYFTWRKLRAFARSLNHNWG